MNRPIATNSAPVAIQALPSLYAVLVKMRLSLLVVMTSAVGYVMASTGPMNWLTLLWTVLGTLLCACSANGLNQVIENRRDAMMARTKDRPLPSGAMSPQHGWIVTMILGYGGLCMLALLVNLPAAGLALVTMLTYVLLYTPMKVHTTLNTLIGAIVGAIPPMIGWVAASGTLTTGAWILAAILFVWQLPHFLSLAWLYREDYAHAGFKMLPGIPGGEHTTCEVVLLTTLLLIPLGLTATMVGIAGVIYAFCSIALGIAFTLPAIRFFKERTRATARRVFLTSLLYLPLLMGIMIADRGDGPPAGRTAILTLQEVDEVNTTAPAPGPDGSRPDGS
ncbi:MAG: heme o synthase [Phycisphaerales bacterium]|nr:heme o synthase [Phycisphaerales bacterium]